jgi:uncharacterized oligopeptide transporter (OPT) family protein
VRSVSQSDVTPPEFDETARARDWLENVYVGDHMPQLTLRAVLTGMALGGVMALSNLYVGFKTGWGLGVTITASILAYALFSGLQRISPSLRGREFTILENNMMASAASAAGYMSSSLFVGAVPALYLTLGQTIGALPLCLWAFSISTLGVFMAIPMKREQINREQLPFPTGIATAETLRALHSHEGDAGQKAWSLSFGALAGAVLGWFREAHGRFMPFNLPSVWIPNASIAGQPLSRLTLGAELSLIMVGAGAIIGLRVATSLLVSALVCYAVAGPIVLNRGYVDLTHYRQAWALWPGVGLLVASGLTSFLRRWRTIARAFAGLARLFAPQPSRVEDPLRDVEAPQRWFVLGTLFSGGLCVAFGSIFFGISWWMGIIAVLLTFLLSLIASRATGETDITPTGAMGKITQLVYGFLAPGNMKLNLMTASVTGGAAIHAADLLTDLKSGYLLGANPRKQVLAQLCGVVAGTAFVVPGYLLLIPPGEIGSEKWPAPAAQIWAGVAKLLAKGISSLPPGAALAMLVGMAVGVALALLEELVPRRFKKYTLSSTAVGIAWVIPAWNSISMFVGALLAFLLQKASPTKAERHTLSIASGVIAGESLIAVLIALLVAIGVLSSR